MFALCSLCVVEEWYQYLPGGILVKTATLQNGHTQNGHKTFCYQNGHNQNSHTAFGQNSHRGRITTKTATLHLVKTATEGGSLPKRPHCIWSKATEGCSLPKRPHYSKMATETETLNMIPERGRITTKTAILLQNGHRGRATTKTTTIAKQPQHESLPKTATLSTPCQSQSSRNHVCHVRRKIQMSDVGFVKIIIIWCLRLPIGRRRVKSIWEDCSQQSRTWYDCGRNDVPFQPMVNDEQEIDGLVWDCGGSSALDYAIGVFMPSIFQCMFAVNSATHDYGTRQKDHYKVPKVKLEVVKNAVRYRGVIIWNMILQNIDIATSLQTFKFHLRQGILSTLITSVSPNESWHS